MSKFQIWIGARNSWGSKGDLQAYLTGQGCEFSICDIGFDNGILIATRDVCVQSLMTKVMMFELRWIHVPLH